MEVKIGIAESARELVVSSDQTADEVSQLVDEALAGGDGLLRLVDEKGRRYVVRANQIAYVEIAPEDGGRSASPSAEARPPVGQRPVRRDRAAVPRRDERADSTRASVPYRDSPCRDRDSRWCRRQLADGDGRCRGTDQRGAHSPCGEWRLAVPRRPSRAESRLAAVTPGRWVRVGRSADACHPQAAPRVDVAEPGRHRPGARVERHLGSGAHRAQQAHWPSRRVGRGRSLPNQCSRPSWGSCRASSTACTGTRRPSTVSVAGPE